jgi:Subtilase family
MDAESPLTVSVSGDEIIAADSSIEMSVLSSVDVRAAQASVALLHNGCPVPIAITCAARGRVIRVDLPRERTGLFELVVTELVSTRGKCIVKDFRRSFAVIPLAGKVPSSWRIEHAARLSVGELHVSRLRPGEKSERGFIDAVKAVHRKSGDVREFAFDHDGREVDLAGELAALAARRARKYGRIHEALFVRIENAKPEEKLPIVVWAKIQLPAAPYEKPSDRLLREPPEGEMRVARAVTKANKTMLAAIEKLKISGRRRLKTADDGVPCVSLTASVAQIRALARDRSIGAIHFDDRTAIVDLKDSIAVARSDRAHTSGFDGTGIRVAVWEDGPSVTTNLTFAGRFVPAPSASNHARLTSAIIKNTEANLPHGHAPDCDLYSANTSGTDALRWAVRDQHCTVVSQSFHRGSEPGGSGLQSDDLLKDWLALRWPYPTILQAAGNFWQGDADNIQPPEDEYVNHKGYNSLAVGNHDDTAAAMAGDSVFRNPASSHGDRELPEIAANGTSVSANGQNMSGTSFAAPATAGVTALLQDVDSVLCSWPEGCRAILLASAGRNIRGGTWWQDVIGGADARDGAGAVDANAGAIVAQQRRWRDAPATRHGWDVGTLSSAVIGGDSLATFRYRVVVPFGLFFPHVKVALAWDSAVTSSGDNATASTLTVDLDVLVKDSSGSIVAVAASWDNSYEIAEFAARAGETYEIVIRRWSGTDSVWYGVAWTVTGVALWGGLVASDVLTQL